MQTHGPQDGFATITLNRPDKANALTATMISDLTGAFRAAIQAGARAIMLTGQGKVFSAGADLEAARAGLATSPLWEELSSTIAEAPALTIAALNGTA
ncbi:MAG TPA: enoyl-CoA hydratase/isomerase family protein, partial [Paracoccus sp.]|nr:enoyl-CoA hydratase/isomerase family protein [Paracoccus sp. (in: a-proteobacteria)]